MIKELQDRGKLAEGRNYGIGFTYLIKKGVNYETIMPYTACKDYLNDVVNIENTKHKSYKEIYGFKHKLTNSFDKKRYFYLSFCSIDNKDTSSFRIDEDTIVNNINNLISNINLLEDHIGLYKSRTTLKDIQNIKSDRPINNKNGYILKVPMWWFNNRFNLSLLTLFIRLSFDKYLETLKITDTFITDDMSFSASFNGFVKLENFKNLFKYKSKILNSISNVHNSGFIYAYQQLRDNKKLDENYDKN
jgi:hypothetical protein